MSCQPRKNKRAVIGIGLGIIAAAVTVVVLLWPHERPLMEVARAITPVEPDQVKVSDAENQETCWLSDHQLLIVTTDPTNSAARFHETQPGVPVYPTWKGSVDLLDTVTRHRSVLTGLLHTIERTTKRPEWRPDSFEISPDGQWIQWQVYGGSDGWPYSRAARLDGTCYREWFRDKRGQETFFLDGQHLCQIEAESDTPMTVRDLSDPKGDRECVTPAQIDAALASYAAHQSTFLDVPDFDEDSVTDLNVNTYRIQDRPRLRAADWAQKGAAPRPLRTSKIALPAVSTLRHREVYLQQNALLFHLRRSHSPPLLVWLHRLFAKVPLKPALTEEIWVSRPDGGGMHQIGYLPVERVERNENGDVVDRISHLEWLPGGKQISFRYRNTLYVVPTGFGGGM